MKTFDEKKDEGMDPIASDHRIEDLAPREEAVMFDNGPEAPAERHSNEAVKGAAWLLAIVGIFAVAVLFAWLIGSHNNPMSSRSDARAAAALTPAAAPLAPQQSAQLVAVFIQPAGQAGQSAATSAKPTSTSSAVAASSAAPATQGSMSSADEDRIEREAREVIHGDFGDNPGRRAKLGADYAAVQARVNQILM